MTIDTFLVEALAVLGTGVVMVFLCARLRVPAVVGLTSTESARAAVRWAARSAIWIFAASPVRA